MQKCQERNETVSLFHSKQKYMYKVSTLFFWEEKFLAKHIFKNHPILWMVFEIKVYLSVKHFQRAEIQG
jgi:hypothetical protein